MVLCIQYNNDPSLPADIDTLYQCMVSAEGTFMIPRTAPNIVVTGLPIGWEIELTEVSKYKLTHNLDSGVIFQIMLQNPAFKYEVIDLTPNFIQIETYNAAGEPAPMVWKYQLRKQNRVHT